MYRLFTSASVFFLVGCAATPQDFAHTDEMTLCMRYLTLPSYNIHQQSRAIAIRQRNIDCSKYYGAANARIRADQNFENMLNNISNQGSSSRPTNRSAPQTTITCYFRSEARSGMNKICYYDCLGSAYATTISAAQICPISTNR